MLTSIITYQDFKCDMRFNAEYYKSEYFETELCLERNRYYTKLFNVANKNKNRFNPLSKPQNTFYYVEIDNVNLIDGRFTYEKLRNYQAPSRARRLLEYKDVFISTVRPNRNAVSIFLKKDDNFVCSTGFAVIKSQAINPFFLFVFLKTKYAIKQLVRKTSAAMYPAVSEDEIMNLKLINPPQSFQFRIEQRVKSACEKQKQAEQKYIKAEAILEKELGLDKIQMQNDHITIINHSDIISDFRIDAQYFSSQKLKSTFLDKFDSKCLKQLCEKIETGLTPAKESYWYKGYPVLKMGCLTNSSIDWSKIEFANESYFKKTKKYFIGEEDIVLTSSAHALEHIAKKVDIVIEIPKEYQNKLVFVGEVMRLRVNKELVNPHYLLLFLRTELGYKLFRNCIRGQTAHIYPKDVEKILIPIISKKKQEKIEELIREAHTLLRESTELIGSSVNEIEKSIVEGRE